MTNIKLALETGEVVAFEYQMDLDGGAFDFEARATKYGEQEVLMIIRDITERKVVEQMKSRLVSVVSHELRTPLTYIKGYAELLSQEQDVSGEERQLFLGIINQEADRLTSLINDFLDIARIESGRVQWRDEHVAIGEVVGTCATTMRVLAERKGQRLELQIPPDLPPAWCNRERVSQVIPNLFCNAIKFTPEDGSIEVTVGACGESDDGNTAKEILVEVSDTGIGISPEDHEKIFDRFGQVGGGEGTHGGTGLGLAITKEIIERHGGTIWVTSSLGQGSTFAFTLPLTPAPVDSDSIEVS